MWWSTVSQPDAAMVRVGTAAGAPRRYRLAGDGATAGGAGPATATSHRLRRPAVRIRLPDPAALARHAASGLLTGRVRRLSLRLAVVPDWLVTGVRPARLGRTVVGFRWHRRGRGLRVTLRWSHPYQVSYGLADVLAAVLRSRPWDQLSGPVYPLDRRAWVAGSSVWPQARPTARSATVDATDPLVWPPVVTAVANPYGRVLAGSARRYRLVPGLGLRDGAGRLVLRYGPGVAAEEALIRAEIDKYAVVSVDGAPDPASAVLLRALAACGMVLAAPDPRVRARLAALGPVSIVDDPAEVTDLAGYAYSVAAALGMAAAGDAALRRTRLAGPAALTLPAVTAIVASRSHAPKHVDSDLLVRVRAAGGLTYRSHGLGYVYVRRRSGHTFDTGVEELLAQGERRYRGLPPAAVQGRASTVAGGDALMPPQVHAPDGSSRLPHAISGGVPQTGH